MKNFKASINNILIFKATVVATVISLLFSGPVLNQIHHTFIRYQGRKVVKVEGMELNGGGTGFFSKGKSGKFYVMTNGHVCRLADKENNVVILYRGQKITAKVVKNYQFNDLCAIESPYNIAMTIASSTADGDSMYVVGHPLLEPISVTEGEQSGPVQIDIMVGINLPPEACTGATYHQEQAPPMAQFFGIETGCFRTLEANAATVNILPGNSGSPALNKWGNVIGVVFAAYNGGGGFRSYVVPLSDLQEFLNIL